MIPIRDDVRSSSFALVNYVFIAANILIFIYELKQEVLSMNLSINIFMSSEKECFSSS